MAPGRASILLALLLGACGGSSTEPAPVTPAPVPEPEQEPADALAEAADEAEAPKPSPDEARAIAALEQLTADPPVAFYVPDESGALVSRAVPVEGSASEVSALLLLAGGKIERLAEWPARAEGDAAHAAAEVRRRLAARFAGKQLVELTWTPWPAGKRVLELPSPAMSVTWQKGGRLSARAGGKRIAIGKVAAVKPHVPRPAGVFASPDSPVAIVVVVHQPVASPGEKVSAMTDVLRFDLPAR